MGVADRRPRVQGLGVGGLTALVQVVIASMVTPRERGRYSGYIGAVFALATVSGPLIGGLIVDIPGSAGAGASSSASRSRSLAFVVLQKTLHLPVVTREVHIDYLGATLIVGGVSLLLVWVSLAGNQFDWISGHQRRLIVVGGLAVLAAAVYVEAKVAGEPIIPLRLFRDRTTSLATVASVLVGVAMFGSTVYLSQYFQIARGMSPTDAGLMSIAMVGGLLVSSIVTGRIITRTGLWKRYLVGGMVARRRRPGAARARSTRPPPLVGASASSWRCSASASAPPCRTSCSRAEQHRPGRHGRRQLAWSRSSASMGGSIGVAALGAVLSHQVARQRDRRASPRSASPTDAPAEPLDPRPGDAAGPGPGGLRAGVRRGDRPHLPGRGAVRGRWRLVCVLFIREVPAAHHDPAGGRDRARGHAALEAGRRGAAAR